MGNYPAAILANFEFDYRKAYEHLSKAYLSLERQYANSGASRFIEISRFEADSEICVRKITEEQISSAVDMADCEPDFVMRNWLYVEDDGTLHPVAIDRSERLTNKNPDFSEDFPFRYASSAMVANGKCVGQVVFTDH